MKWREKHLKIEKVWSEREFSRSPHFTNHFSTPIRIRMQLRDDCDFLLGSLWSKNSSRNRLNEIHGVDFAYNGMIGNSQYRIVYNVNYMNMTHIFNYDFLFKSKVQWMQMFRKRRRR